MKLRPSEEHIRSLFKNHEQPVDTDELWKKMQEKEKPRRRIVWFRFLLMRLPLALIVVYVIIYGLGNHINHTMTSMEQSTNGIEKTNREIDNNRDDINVVEEGTQKDLAGANVNQTSDSLLLDVNQIAENNKPIAVNEIATKDGVKNSASINNIHKTIGSVVTSPSIDVSQSTINNNSKMGISSPMASVRSNVSGDDINIVDKSSRKVNIADQNVDKVFKNENVLKNSLGNNTNNDIDSYTDENKVISQIPGLITMLFYDRILSLEMEEVKVIPVLQQEKETRNYRTLSVIAGIGLGNKNLATRDFTDTAYVEFRKAAEKIHSIWNGAIKVGFHKNIFVFNTGLSYRQHIESLRYSSRDISISQEDGTISTIVDGQGNILSTQSGIITTTTTTTYDFLKENRYHYLGIPLEVGANVGIGKFRVGLLASTEVSMAIKRSGAYLDTVESFLDFSAEESIIDYDRKVLFQLGLRSNISYAVKENMSFTIQPYVMRYINSMTTSVNSLEEKPTHFGVDFGLVYRFNRK